MKTTSSAFDALPNTADPETLDMVRQMVGKKELALYMAKTIANEIGGKVNAGAVSKIFGISVDHAYNKISRVNLKGFQWK